MKKILFLFLCLQLSSLALPVDEKLTMRFLEVSQSKKTVLINRGLEDGLVIGDHAKFFISRGVIARGVVVKASPSRSIWSIYRLVSPMEVEKSKVLNLKIATPVKLTDDPSKSLYALASQDKQMGEPVDIIKGAGAQNELSLSGEGMSESRELGALMSDDDYKAPQVVHTGSNAHSMELWGLASVSNLAGTYSNSTSDYSAMSSSISFAGGVEKYFSGSTGFLRNFSLKAFANYNSIQSGTSINQTTTITDFGAGLSYYFGKNGPFSSNKLTYFIDGNIGLSSTSLTIDDQVDDSRDDAVDGSGSFYSVGLGAKYLVKGSFGAVTKLDYYTSVSTFDIEVDSELITEELSVGGPRFMVGLFYRFF